MAGKDSLPHPCPLAVCTTLGVRVRIGWSREQSSLVRILTALTRRVCVLLSCGNGHDLAGAQPVRSIHHNIGSSSGTAVEDRYLSFSERDFDRLDLGNCVSLSVAV